LSVSVPVQGAEEDNWTNEVQVNRKVEQRK